jgi:hypothetical protein
MAKGAAHNPKPLGTCELSTQVHNLKIFILKKMWIMLMLQLCHVAVVSEDQLDGDYGFLVNNIIPPSWGHLGKVLLWWTLPPM